MAEDGREDGHDEADGDEDREVPGEKKGGGRWNDEHRDNDDGADCFEGCDGRDGDHGHEKVVHELRSEALGFGKAGVEGSKFEFLVEESDDERVEKKGGTDDESGPGNGKEGGLVFEERDHIKRRVFERSVKNTPCVKVDVVGCFANEDKSDGEEGGEDDSHGGAAFHLAEAGDPLGEKGGEDSGDGSAEEHPDVGARSGDEEGDGEAGKDRVADGVTHHAHSAKKEKGARERTGHRTQASDEDYVEVVRGPGHDEVLEEE